MKKKSFLDQLGRQVEFDFPPQRIISLVPSQTELLFDLGLADRVVGVTKFCTHPKEAREKTIVGGTKKFRMDVIDGLYPDLILGNKEENYQSGIAMLTKRYPVWMSDIADWESALQMIRSVGDLTGAGLESNLMTDEIQIKFENLKQFSAAKTLYLIWKNPWMAAGKNTFIDTMLSKIGLMNCLEQQRYPELSFEALKALAPEIILLSSEPFPFAQSHIEELQLLLPDSKIILVDGEMFSWYGSRLLKASDYLSSLALDTH